MCANVLRCSAPTLGKEVSFSQYFAGTDWKSGDLIVAVLRELPEKGAFEIAEWVATDKANEQKCYEAVLAQFQTAAEGTLVPRPAAQDAIADSCACRFALRAGGKKRTI